MIRPLPLLVACLLALGACRAPAKERAAKPLARITPTASGIQRDAGRVESEAQAARAEIRGGITGLELPEGRRELLDAASDRQVVIGELAEGIGSAAAEVVRDSADARVAVAEIPPPRRSLLSRLLWPWALYVLLAVLAVAALPQVLPWLMGWLWKRGIGLSRAARSFGKLASEALREEQSPEERERLMREAAAALRQSPQFDSAFIHERRKRRLAGK